MTRAEMFAKEVARVHDAFMEHIVSGDHDACGGSCLVLGVYAEAYGKFRDAAVLPSQDPRMYDDPIVESLGSTPSATTVES